MVYKVIMDLLQFHRQSLLQFHRQSLYQQIPEQEKHKLSSNDSYKTFEEQLAILKVINK